MKHVHFDEVVVNAACDRLSEKLQPWLADAESGGAQTRMMAAALRPALLAMVAELNRGTEPVWIAMAIANLCSNLVMSFAHTLEPNDRAACVHCVNDVLVRMTVMLGKALNGDPALGGGVEHVAPTPGGTA